MTSDADSRQIELWESAAAAFDSRHSQVRAEHQALPTPCDDFDVKALVEHVIGNQVTIGKALGSTAETGASWSEARQGLAADASAQERMLAVSGRRT